MSTSSTPLPSSSALSTSKDANTIKLTNGDKTTKSSQSGVVFKRKSGEAQIMTLAENYKTVHAGSQHSYEKKYDTMVNTSSSSSSTTTNPGETVSKSDVKLQIESIFACRHIKEYPNSTKNLSPCPTESCEEKDTAITQKKESVEYLIKFHGMSYRRLLWITKEHLSQCSCDNVEAKLLNFHRRSTFGDTTQQVYLTPQQEGNFQLYIVIDRIIAVRIAKKKKNERKFNLECCGTFFFNTAKTAETLTKSGTSKDKISGEKEYLVKWKHLGYASATWETEQSLSSFEDKSHIKLFERINTTYTFVPFQNIRVKHETTCLKSETFLDSESYSYKANINDNLLSPLWKSFVATKMAEDGTYKPSTLEWRMCQHCSMDKDDCYWQLKQGRRLMSHQQDGVKWLCYNTEIQKHNSLLADEMGLGKTCQSITFLEHYIDQLTQATNHGHHALVVVQKSVVDNWRREFEICAPHLYVYPLCGRKEDRQISQLYELDWICPNTGNLVSTSKIKTKGNSLKLIKPDVVLVTLESIRSYEFNQLSKILESNWNSRKIPGVFHWDCIIVDECQKLKGGQDSVLLQHLSGIRKRLAILLTGTPIQNSTKELFPLLVFLNPQMFCYPNTKNKVPPLKDSWSVAKFNERFSNIQDREDCMQRTEELHNLLAPFVLRREKINVLKTLSPKNVSLIKIPLTLIQKRVYSAIYHRSLRVKNLKLSNIHMQLRKCCIHPFLVNGVEELIVSGQITNSLDEGSTLPSKDPSQPETTLQHPILIDETNKNENNVSNFSNIKKKSEDNEEDEEERIKSLILESSGKFILLKKMFDYFYQLKRKILLFSYFKSALDIIEDFISLNKYTWLLERVDGESPGEKRQLAIDRFNNNESCFLFLCTTRAAGLGINLSAASVVIHLDSDFNPQHDLQAQARCHRIGQSQNVNVFHFITEHTYEDYMFFTIAGKKLGLEAVLLGRLDATHGKLKLNKQQEESVLRKGVYAAIRDDEITRKAAAEFAKLSIEDILSIKSATIALELNSIQEANKNINRITSPKEELPHPSSSMLSESKPLENFPFLSNFVKKPESVQNPLTENLDESDPDFWVHVAQRLQPHTIVKSNTESPELTRSSRRRNQFRANVSECISSITAKSESNSDQDTSSVTLTDSKRNFSEKSNIADYQSDTCSSSTSPLSSIEEFQQTFPLVNKVSDNVLSKVPAKKKKKVQSRVLPCSTIDSKDSCNRVVQIADPSESNRKDESNLQFFMTESNFSAPQTFDIMSSVLKEDVVSSKVDDLSNHVPFDTFYVTELLYCSLRAIRYWEETPVGRSGHVKINDIRNADKRLPWCAYSRDEQDDLPSNQILWKSWFDCLEEFKSAQNDWEALKIFTIKYYSQTIIDKEEIFLQLQWQNYIDLYKNKGLELPKTPDKEKFFQEEAIRLTLTVFREDILKKLQLHNDELAKNIVVDSQNTTQSKQSWSFIEDFCIKLIFIHLMMKSYSLNKSVQIYPIMRWGQWHNEINWGLISDILRKLNKYIGRPERRRCAIQERFYNKLDCRWNQSEFTEAERNILSLAAANRMPARVVIQQMPGRTLERVKLGLKSCFVTKKNQDFSDINEAALNLSETEKTAYLNDCGGEKSSVKQKIVTRKTHLNPTEAIHDNSAPFDSVFSQKTVIDEFDRVLTTLDIHSTAKFNLINILKIQPVSKLTTLLHNLQKLLEEYTRKNKSHPVDNNELSIKEERCSSEFQNQKASSLTEAALQLSASLQAVPLDIHNWGFKSTKPATLFKRSFPLSEDCSSNHFTLRTSYASISSIAKGYPTCEDVSANTSAKNDADVTETIGNKENLTASILTTVSHTIKKR